MSPSKLTKYCACHAKWPSNIWQKFAENSWNVISNARPIRDRSETVSVSPQPATQPRLLFRSGRTVCIEKYNISRSGYLSKFHQILRLPRKVTLELHQVLRLPRKVTLELHQVLRLPRKLTLELHQVLRLPRKVTLELHQVLRLPHRMTRRLDPRHIWNAISNARRNKCHPPNSPNTAPATQNDHPTSGRNLRKTAETSFPMRGRSETVPRPFPSVRNPPLNRGYFFAPDERFVLKNTTFRVPAIFPNFTKYCAYHEKWHLNFTKYCAYHAKWHLNFTKYCAYHENWHLNFTKYCAYHEKWHLNFTKYCAYHEKWHLTFTKYCACHTEWLAGLILVTYETSFPMRAETNVTLQTHQILRLPRKMTIQHLAEICGKQLKRHFQCAADPRPFRDRFRQSATRHSTEVTFSLRSNGLYWKIQHFAFRLSFQISPNTAPTTKSDTWTSPSTAPTTQSDTWTSPSTAPTTKTDTWTSPSTAPTTKSDTWPSPSIAPATQNDSQAWSSSHMKRHFQCAQKQMSPSKLTKYCACHAKWPSNIWQKFAENSWNVISNARPIRDRSETVSVSPQPATQPRLLFALRTNGLYWTIQHFALRLSFQISPSPAPTTQSDTWTSPSTAPTTKTDTWTSPSTAPTTKSDTWPSPSTAPATQNDSRL